MFQKIATSIIIIISISVIALQDSLYAQNEIGIGKIIFGTNYSTGEDHDIRVDEIGYTLIKIHMQIAGKDLEKIYYQGEALQSLQQLEYLTKQNIIDFLDISTDKKEALQIYLNTTYKELQRGESIATQMQQEMNIIKSDMEACAIDKAISDKEYFAAINRYDQKIMETSLQESLFYEKCATEKRIQYNAQTALAKKLVFYLSVLQKKHDVLYKKQDIINKNFEVFKDNILPDLNYIDQILKKYTF